jgi:uncharacterized protein YijF (DUF1287 family)
VLTARTLAPAGRRASARKAGEIVILTWRLAAGLPAEGLAMAKVPYRDNVQAVNDLARDHYRCRALRPA